MAGDKIVVYDERIHRVCCELLARNYGGKSGVKVTQKDGSRGVRKMIKFVEVSSQPWFWKVNNDFVV